VAHCGFAFGKERKESSVSGMRIVFLTNDTFDSSEKFRYMFANVAASFAEVHVVAVRRSRAEQMPFLPRLQERARKVLWRVRRFGFLHTLEVLTSLPLQLFIGQRNWREVDERLRQLCRPAAELRPDKAVYVETIDGPETVEAISRLEPDVVIQEAAGILRRQVFEVAHIGTINLHAGIAPLLRGQDPVYWALWEQRSEWLGATVHCIDEGVDTGPVLAYAPVEPRYPGERFPPLYARITKLGTKHLVDALCRLERGERWAIPPPEGERVYRTIFSGWRLLLLEIRLALERRRAHPGPQYSLGGPKRVAKSTPER
jgi:folate-dependent phosphoribosylglycinamide formyltransferase PurN